MPLDIGIVFKPIPVRDSVIELDVVTLIKNVSIDFNILVKVFFFYNSFWAYDFNL